MRLAISLALTLPLSFALGIAHAADGVVVDPAGRPVSGARVECAGKSTTTTTEGKFSSPDAARCTARVSAPGFETATVELDAGSTARIALTIAGIGERIVVSATRHETNPEEAGVAATVLTAADLETRQNPILGDALTGVPGLAIARSGRPGSVTSIFTRGGNSTDTLLLIDGVPVNDPGGELNLGAFSTDSIDHIEVIRGPESALYGVEAASGVIQLFTKRGDAEDTVPHGSVSYDRGSFQTDHYTANIGGGLAGRFDYALGADQYQTVGEYQNDFFRDTTGTANLGYRFSQATQLRASFRELDGVLGNPNQIGFGILDTEANEHTRDSLVSVQLDDVRGPNFVQRFSFGYHRLSDLTVDPQNGTIPILVSVEGLVRTVPGTPERTYFEGLAPLSMTTAPPGLELVQGYGYLGSAPFLDLSSRMDADYQGTLTNHGGATVFGYSFEHQMANISASDYARDNHAGYIHHQQVIAHRLFLSGGVRLEHNSAFGMVLTPRGAASYLLTGGHGPLSSTYLRFSAGLGIIDPSIFQNYAQNRPYYWGNQGLRPAKTVSYEFGIAQEWFSKRLRTEVSAFDNTFKDLIEFVNTTWLNVDRSRARGIEFSAEAKPFRYLTVGGNYTRMWTRVISSTTPDDPFNGVGDELPRRPGNAGAVWVTLAPRRWTFQTGARFVGEEQDVEYVFYAVNRNPGYQDVYASGSYRVNKHFMPFMRAGNVLNSRYSEVLGYPALSRDLHGGLRVEW